MMATMNSTNISIEATQCIVEPSNSNILYGLGMSLIVAMSVFGNLLVVVTFSKSPVLKQKVTSPLIISLGKLFI